MGTVVFSDVHADADALGLVAAYIRDSSFSERFGPVDTLVNLGDLLHRGNCPQATLELIHDLSQAYHLVSVIGNHDHAFLNGVPVSGSDELSTIRHEQTAWLTASRHFFLHAHGMGKLQNAFCPRGTARAWDPDAPAQVLAASLTYGRRFLHRLPLHSSDGI